MSIMQNMTIKRKLILIIMFTCTIALLLTGTLNLFHQRTQIRKELIRSISCYAEIIGENCRAALSFEDEKDTSEMLKSLDADSSIVFACVYTKEGKVLASYRRPDITEDIQTPLCAKESYWFNNHYFKLFKRIDSGDEVIGTVYIQLDMSEMNAHLRLEAGIMILLVLACSLVAYLVSLRLQRVVSKPILSLAEVARAVSEKKDYSTRAPKQNNDEVGSLIDAFNEMLEQIQQRDLALIDTKNQLETRVKERTAELTLANEELTREVTERKRAELAILDREQRLNLALQGGDLGTWDWNILTDEVIFNDKWAHMKGYDPDEIKPHFSSWVKIVHPEDLPKVQEILRAYFEGETPAYEAEFRIRHKSGQWLWILDRGKIIKRDDDGKPLRVCGTHMDITDRKQAEEALLTNEARLLNAMKIAHLGYWEYDVVDDQFAFNDRFYDIFHTTAEQVGGYKMKPARYAELFVYPDDRQVVAIEMKKALETTDPQYNRQLEHRIVYPTGEIGYISVRFSIVKDKQGRTIKTFGANQDITDRKRAEIELKNTHEKLLETSRMAGMAEVAADVLHNVGNVLNSINVSTTLVVEKVTNSELANLEKLASIVNDHIDDLGTFLTEHPQGKHIPVYLKEVSKHLIDEQADIVSKLRVLAENVEHVKEIISSQQSYAKISGVEIRASIAKLVEDAIQINRAGLERHGTQLIREFEELPDVQIDKQKLLQILVNLISNAKYAMSNNDKEEKLLTIRLYKHGEDCFRIEVADNGIGIPEDNLTRIFSHGFTTKRNGHGFGLHSSALASKEIGGSLTVHSDGVGRGAMFTLELPFKPAEVIK